MKRPRVRQSFPGRADVGTRKLEAPREIRCVAGRARAERRERRELGVERHPCRGEVADSTSAAAKCHAMCESSRPPTRQSAERASSSRTTASGRCCAPSACASAWIANGLRGSISSARLASVAARAALPASSQPNAVIASMMSYPVSRGDQAFSARSATACTFARRAKKNQHDCASRSASRSNGSFALIVE